jgi:hypothetical protein
VRDHVAGAARASSRPRGVRTKSAWLLAVPFLALARPALEPLAAGGAIALIGLVLRGWSAGTIRKDEELTTSGPYAHLRHPLYVGSFLIGVGMSVAGGHWVWTALVVGFFAALYGRTLAEEGERLATIFGTRYQEYAARVPALLPRLTPFRPAEGATSGFAWRRYARNREWEALLGTAAAFAALAAKARWMS